MQLIFNELSVSRTKLSIADANKLMSTFLQTYSEILRVQPNVSRCIATTISFNDLEIYSGYYISQWRNSRTVDKDEKRRFLGICDKQCITTPSYEDSLLVLHKGEVGKGLQIAYEKQGPLISLPSSEDWEQHSINCTLFDVECEEETEISLRNVSTNETTKKNSQWIVEEIAKEYNEVKTPKDFLSKYEQLFPSLYFHDNALSQIKNQINPVNIPTVVEKLLTLEKYFSTWDGKVFDRKEFPPRFISPESPETLDRYKKEHTFEWNDKEVLVSYHVRYTGGDVPGRIFVYPDHDTRKCIVFSLYTKLPTVKFPNCN